MITKIFKLSAAYVVLFGLAIQATPTTAQASEFYNFNDGQLERPTGYREWIYVGTPLTPDDMNDGKAAFPEFHNVYIDPESWAHWKKASLGTSFRPGLSAIQ